MSFYDSEQCRTLKAQLGFKSDEEIDKFFLTVEDDGYNWVLKVGWTDAKSYAALQEWAKEWKGKYIPANTKVKHSTYVVPKDGRSISEKDSISDIVTLIPLSLLIEPAFKIRLKPDFEIDDLINSVKKHGVLEPILVRRKGDKYEIAGGSRRYRAAKAVGLENIPAIIKSLNDLEANTLQLVENFQRKDLTDEEKTAALDNYAEVHGLKAKQIAENLGRSYSWVVTYLSPKYKDEIKAEAGRLGGEAKAEAYRESQDFATSRVAEPELARQPEDIHEKTKQTYNNYMLGNRECEKCGKQVKRQDMTFKEGLLICPDCAGIKPKKEEPPKPPAKPPVAKDTWEHRLGQMKVQKSQDEIDLLTELARRGITPRTDLFIPLWGTTPDGVYEDKKLIFYVHGQVHDKGKALNRDDEIVAALEREGWLVMVFRHGDSSTMERADKIQEALKW
jgi:ParB/RepB/Spo0J family partition protein